MKKYIFLFLALIVFMGTGLSQDAKAKYKHANRNMRKYLLDQSANLDNLMEAKAIMQDLIKDDEYKESLKAWMLKGKIENEVAARDVASYALDPNFEAEDDMVAVSAFESFHQALDMAIKKYQKGDALKAMSETSQYLNAIGLTLYQKGKYELAYKHFKKVLEVDKFLKDNDMKSALATDVDYNNQLYITGVSAMSGKMLDEAVECFQKMLDRNDKRAIVYEAMFKYYLEQDEEKAVAFLNEGRAAFPDESSLLFAEINYYLGKGELDKLVDKLKLAREKEPNNVSIINTEANVYDNLYQKADKSGDAEMSKKYFDLAKKTYDEALAIKADDFIATYSLGALYYNQAASISKEVNELADDYTKEGAKKYDAKKKEMEEYFDLALPYFEKSEIIDDKDKNTLIALKEIYARKNMFDKSGEYKKKIDALAE